MINTHTRIVRYIKLKINTFSGKTSGAIFFPRLDPLRPSLWSFQSCCTACFNQLLSVPLMLDKNCLAQVSQKLFALGCSAFISLPIRSMRCMASNFVENCDLHKAATLVPVPSPLDGPGRRSRNSGLPLQQAQSM